MRQRDHSRLLGNLSEEYRRRFPESNRLHQQARETLINGGSHNLRLIDPFPPRIREARGPRITDEDGQFTLAQGAYPGKYYFETAIPSKGFGPFVMGLKRAKNQPIHIEGPVDIRGLEVVVGGEDDPKDRIGAESGAASPAPDLQQPEPGTSVKDLAPIPAAA